MSIENNEVPVAKETEAAAQESKASEALLGDIWGKGGAASTDEEAPMEERRRHHHYYPYPFGNAGFNKPESKVSALQYQVRDGKITVLSR